MTVKYLKLLSLVQIFVHENLKLLHLLSNFVAQLPFFSKTAHSRAIQIKVLKQ